MFPYLVLLQEKLHLLSMLIWQFSYTKYYPRHLISQIAHSRDKMFGNRWTLAWNYSKMAFWPFWWSTQTPFPQPAAGWWSWWSTASWRPSPFPGFDPGSSWTPSTWGSRAGPRTGPRTPLWRTPCCRSRREWRRETGRCSLECGNGCYDSSIYTGTVCSLQVRFEI